MVAIIRNVVRYSRPYIDSVKSRISSERGQDLIEYALLSGVIAIGLIAVGAAAWLAIGNGLAGAIGDCVDFDTLTNCGPLG